MPGLGIDVETPDVELVRLCRAGDEAAVRELTRRYNRRLFRIARGILRDDAEAEDVVQDAYVRAFTHLDSFRGEAGVGTWLVRIAMNEALARKRRQRPMVDVDTMPMASHERDPETEMAHQQLRAALERAIDRLPDQFRLIFIARLVEGMTIEETAAAFDLRPETVKTRVHRARVQLRRILESESAPVLADAFAFDGDRCNRLTEAVVRRLREPSSPSSI